MRGNITVPSDIHILIPGLVNILVTWQREMPADKIEVVNQVMLKYQNYFGLSRCSQCNHKVIQMEERVKRGTVRI